MTGKSDVLDAVVEWMILRILEERGPTRALLLSRELRRRSRGTLSITDTAVSIALQRLELSGWLQNHQSPAAPSKERVYKLTRSAERYMPKELEQWQFFLANSNKITALVERFVGSEGTFKIAVQTRRSA
jgi:DNA-binding PadR family transcriptional regulator